jgi:hypothetical protein
MPDSQTAWQALIERSGADSPGERNSATGDIFRSMLRTRFGVRSISSPIQEGNLRELSTIHTLPHSSHGPSNVPFLHPSNSHPCPTCCICHAAPEYMILALSTNAGLLSTTCFFYDSHPRSRILPHFPRHNIPTVFLSIEPGASNEVSLTFGRLTLGTMTLCRALGASFGGFLGSPPG